MAATPTSTTAPATPSALVVQLGAAAIREADRAVDHFANEMYPDFYVHAGAALELALKAALARMNPLLLAPNVGDWFSSAPPLVSGAALTPGQATKTVGGVDAANRLWRLDERRVSKSLVGWVKSVLDARNDVVHAGLCRPNTDSEHRAVGADFFRALLHLNELANPNLTQPNYTLFGHHANLVRATVTKNIDEASFRVSQLVSNAKRKVIDMSADHLAAAVVGGEIQVRSRLDLGSVEVTCPACGNAALGTGDLFDNGFADQEDGEDYWVPAPMVGLQQVRCFVCDLTLVDDEIGLAGLSRAVDHPTATPEDLVDYDWDDSND